jgi:hypothetical protein
MDQQRQQQINRAAEQFADAIRSSYQAVSERGRSTQERNAQLTEQFFNTVIDNLRTQAEDNREMVQELVDQQQRQREATRSLTQESASAYMDFLNSMFSFYQGSVQETARGAGRAERSAEEVESDAIREAKRSVEEAGRSAAEAAESQSRADGAPPLEDYDSLNVREVTERLDDLSVDELRQLRDYESKNKNRQTVMERLTQRIEAEPS